MRRSSRGLPLVWSGSRSSTTEPRRPNSTFASTPPRSNSSRHRTNATSRSETLRFRKRAAGEHRGARRDPGPPDVGLEGRALPRGLEVGSERVVRRRLGAVARRALLSGDGRVGRRRPLAPLPEPTPLPWPEPAHRYSLEFQLRNPGTGGRLRNFSGDVCLAARACPARGPNAAGRPARPSVPGARPWHGPRTSGPRVHRDMKSVSYTHLRAHET